MGTDRAAQRVDMGGLGRVFDQLATGRSAASAGLSADERDALEAMGLQIRGNRVWLEEDVELLSAAAVREGLAPATLAWLRDMDLCAHIASTNTSLLARGRCAGIAGCVLGAEVQTAGRGRRGRMWLSPFGRNLAVSIGVGIERPVAEIGTLSLVVGIAVRRALLGCGLTGVALKWPNDVLLNGRKLAGILIELVRAVPPVEVVIGIGVNVGCATRIAESIDQSVADVAEQIDRPSRNHLLARMLDEVVAACRHFDEAGFESFRTEWNEVHYYRGERVVVTPADLGEGAAANSPASYTGKVLDVAGDGALRIETADGVRSFTGGEVTLRDATSARSGARR